MKQCLFGSQFQSVVSWCHLFQGSHYGSQGAKRENCPESKSFTSNSCHLTPIPTHLHLATQGLKFQLPVNSATCWCVGDHRHCQVLRSISNPFHNSKRQCLKILSLRTYLDLTKGIVVTVLFCGCEVSKICVRQQSNIRNHSQNC